MKNEPELIDIFAVFAMQALTRNPPQPNELWVDYCEETSLEAYMMAEAMMKQRKNFINKGGNDD
jgi:hypothetical protein